jgi:nitrogen fixation protein FixH
MTATAKPAHFTLKGWHVLVGFVVFFGIDIAINTVFMVSAYKTFPGETTLTPYEDGLAYNAALKQKRQQAALGWRLAAGVEDHDQLRVEVVDRTGAPIKGLQVMGKLERPATEDGERTLPLKEVAPGVYAARPGGLTGAWDFEVTAVNARGDVAKADRRLYQP